LNVPLEQPAQKVHRVEHDMQVFGHARALGRLRRPLRRAGGGACKRAGSGACTLGQLTAAGLCIQER
jgi:hypothetical protein